jgi:CheY-like chemotaxis protein
VHDLHGEPMARILLVDDYPDAVDVWALYLRVCGFEVICATDGAAALELALRDAPDAAILDLELPGLSGVELARSIRRDGRLGGIPLIAMTGHSQAARLAEARAAGFNLVITKPCEPERLAFEVQRLLGAAAVPPATANRQGDAQTR